MTCIIPRYHAYDKNFPIWESHHRFTLHSTKAKNRRWSKLPISCPIHLLPNFPPTNSKPQRPGNILPDPHLMRFIACFKFGLGPSVHCRMISKEHRGALSGNEKTVQYPIAELIRSPIRVSREERSLRVVGRGI